MLAHMVLLHTLVNHQCQVSLQCQDRLWEVLYRDRQWEALL